MKRKLFLALIVFLVCACVPVVPASLTNLAPTSAPEAVATQGLPMQLPPPTEPTSFEVSWSTFHDDQLGISFEYPSVYDTSQYESCSVKVTPLPDGAEISIGHQSFLLIQPSNGVALREYMDTLIAQKQWKSEFEESRIVGGEDAIYFEYRFGGSRFGTATVTVHDNMIYAFNFSAGNFCDAPEANLGEGYAYQHWQESFMFTR